MNNIRDHTEYLIDLNYDTVVIIVGWCKFSLICNLYEVFHFGFSSRVKDRFEFITQQQKVSIGCGLSQTIRRLLIIMVIIRTYYLFMGWL